MENVALGRENEQQRDVEINPAVVAIPLKQDAARQAAARKGAVLGMSPVLHRALRESQDRLQEFDTEVVNELKKAFLDAANEVADRHGITVDTLSFFHSEDLADFTVSLSTVDVMGHDRHARCLLEKCEEAGVPPRLLGKSFVNKGDGHRLVVTGLIEHKPGQFVVRMYNMTKHEICHAPCSMVVAAFKTAQSVREAAATAPSQQPPYSI